MIQVICCSSLLSVPGRAGAFSRDFTTSLAPGCRALSGALKIEKLKAPLIPSPEGAVDTNYWCTSSKQYKNTRFRFYTRKKEREREITKQISRVMRKPTFCICETKDADQLRYIDSTIPLLSKSKISCL